MLLPIDKKLFEKRGLPDDPRWGDYFLTSSHKSEETAEIVILGCPQDEGVSRNRGRPGAAAAPLEIRRALYRLTTNGLDPHRVSDVGDVNVSGSLEEVHHRLLQQVQTLATRKKTLIILGGGNDISYPDALALHQARGRIRVLNVDAHFDVRPGALATSGTPYRQLLESGALEPCDFWELAWQAQLVSSQHESWLRERGAHLLDLAAVRNLGVASAWGQSVVGGPDTVFVGFDMDCVRAADAPGVSAPSPLGLAAEEAVELAQLAGSDKRVKLFEITEVNPKFDVDSRTARLAALMIHEFIRTRQKIAMV